MDENVLAHRHPHWFVGYKAEVIFHTCFQVELCGLVFLCFQCLSLLVILLDLNLIG